MEHLKIKSAVNANLQNAINRSLILHYVRNHSPLYRSQISRALSLSLPAISRAVDGLLQQGFLVEKRIVTRTGKKAHEVEINSSLGASIGITLEPPYIRIGRMDMAGTLTDLHESDALSVSENPQDQLIGIIDNFLARCSSSSGDHPDPPIAAMCISVPAAVENNQEQVHAVLFRSLREQNITRMLHDRYKVPVFLENSENLCVLAEKYYQQGSPAENIAFITVHYGIGAGLLLNGRLYRGVNGAAGEIGQQYIGINPYPGQSKLSTFELEASIHQIQQIALNSIHQGRGGGEEIFKTAGYNYQNITHELVSSMAAAGSEAARNILASYAEILGIGIANLLVTVNPELLILGGRICEIENPDEFIIAPLKKQLEKLIPFPVPQIRMTSLGQHAAVIGACQLALENTILHQFPYIIDT